MHGFSCRRRARRRARSGLRSVLLVRVGQQSNVRIVPVAVRFHVPRRQRALRMRGAVRERHRADRRARIKPAARSTARRKAAWRAPAATLPTATPTFELGPMRGLLQSRAQPAKMRAFASGGQFCNPARYTGRDFRIVAASRRRALLRGLILVDSPNKKWRARGTKSSSHSHGLSRRFRRAKCAKKSSHDPAFSFTRSCAKSSQLRRTRGARRLAASSNDASREHDFRRRRRVDGFGAFRRGVSLARERGRHHSSLRAGLLARR